VVATPSLAVEALKHELLRATAMARELASAAVATQIARCAPAAADFDAAALDAGYAEVEQRWHQTKSVLLEAASRREIPVARLNGALEGLPSALRLAEQLTKAAQRQAALGLPAASASDVIAGAVAGEVGGEERAAGIEPAAEGVMPP